MSGQVLASRIFSILLRFGLKVDCLDMRRVFSSILLSATTLLLLTFAFDEVGPKEAGRFFCAQLYLSILFTLQSVFTRLFEADQADGAFLTLRSLAPDYNAWYLARLAVAIVSALIAVIPSYLMAGLFHSQFVGLSIFSPWIILSALLAIFGLAAMGLLLSALTLKAKSKEVLFPLLYFPLTTPILLAATQSSLSLLTDGSWENTQKWLLLAAGFDVIYLVLGLMLFSEILEDAP